jgi:hypothetical protein
MAVALLEKIRHIPKLIKGFKEAKKLKNAAAAASKSKPLPKTNPVPKGQSPYKPTPQGGGGGARTNYKKPSSTSRPSTGTNPKTGTGSPQSGYNKPSASLPKTPAAKVKGAASKIVGRIPTGTATVGWTAKKALEGAKWGAPKLPKLISGAGKLANRMFWPYMIYEGGKVARDFFKKDAPAGDKETGVGTGNEWVNNPQGYVEDQGGWGLPAPEGSAASVSTPTTTPTTTPADPAVNKELRDKIFGEQTDERSWDELMADPKFGGKPKVKKATEKTGGGSGSGSKTGLDYLRSRDEVKRMDREGKADIAAGQRERRLDAEARFRGRRDFIEEGRKIKDPNIIRKDGQELGRVIKDSTGRIVGHSLNKAGRAAMGNRKGAGVIDGSMRDTALGLDERDRQIAGMRSNQDAVANLYHSSGGESRGVPFTGDPFGARSAIDEMSKSSSGGASFTGDPLGIRSALDKLKKKKNK